jgi:hypothetical protein
MARKVVDSHITSRSVDSLVRDGNRYIYISEGIETEPTYTNLDEAMQAYKTGINNKAEASEKAEPGLKLPRK